MDGSDDFRPGSERRASDPSLEDMLRRARDARLGDDQTTPPYTSPVSPFPREPVLLPAAGPWVSSWTLFLGGIIIGILLCYAVIQASASPGAFPTPAHTAVQSVTTPLPTATEMPTPTAPPTAPPPTAAVISALVQAYYDTQGPYAGTYLLRDVTALQIDNQDNGQLTVCIAYDAAPVSAPDAMAGSNTRLFTLVTTSDGTWQVVQMGGPGSCNLN